MSADKELLQLPERIADLPQQIVLIVAETLRFMKEKQHGKIEFSCADGTFTLMRERQQKFP